MSKISNRILEILSEKEISYGELSYRTGIPKSALQRYATGETEKIPVDRLELIAASIGTTPAYLMGWIDEKKSATDNDDGLSELADIFISLSPENRSKLLELSRLYLNAQGNSAGNK